MAVLWLHFIVIFWLKFEVYQDTLQTNFWMFMCFGRKRWRLVSRDDLSLLHPRYLCDLNPVFPADLNAFQDGQSGKPRQLTIHEINLEADDLIFVPAGWPHQVDNLETSVAMSANFIDASNVQRCIEEAEVMATVEENPGLWATWPVHRCSSIFGGQGSRSKTHLQYWFPHIIDTILFMSGPPTYYGW